MSLSDPQDSLFHRTADRTLLQLEKKLGQFDPDDVDVDLGDDVLTLLIKNRDQIVIHRHGAARQIWMAAQRKAWHFDLDEEKGLWMARTEEELFSVLERVISSLLQREIRLV